MLHIFLVGVVMILSTSTGLAQPENLEFESYTTNKGLSQNEVFSIIQDQRGFLWFGTDEGLNRFDGYEFKTYYHEPNNPGSIADNSVRALAMDDDGVIWIGTANSLCRYYPETEQIERLEVNYDDPSKPKGTGINKILKDRDGNMWICYLGSGVDVFRKKTREFFHYIYNDTTTHHINNDYVISLTFMPNGETMLATRGGIEVIDKQGIALTHEKVIERYPWADKVDQSVTYLTLCRDQNTLMIGSELNGFYQVTLSTGVISNFNTGNSALHFNNNVPIINEDSRGRIWIGGEAIYLFDRNTHVLTPYNEHGKRNDVVEKNPILSIFEDRDHNIWFGTYREGALKYDPNNFQIQHYPNLVNESPDHATQVLSFAEDDNNDIWVGTDGNGLFRFDRKKVEFEPAKHHEPFSSLVIKSMYRDKRGNLWLGTWEGGLMCYTPSTQHVKVFHPDSNNFISRHVWEIVPDSLDNLWIGSLRDGIIYFNTKTYQYTTLKSNPSDSTTLINNDIMCIFLDSEKNMWVGTSNGISIMRAGTKVFKNLRQERHPELNLNVLSLAEDTDGNMWLGTNGGGIVVMDKQLHVLKTITEENGLPSSTVCALQRDDKGNLWVSTYKGIVKVDRKDKSLLKIPRQAIHGNEFIPQAYYYGNDGELFFGGVFGFNAFNPDSLNVSRPIRSIYFTSLKVLNDEIIPNKEYNGKVITSKSIATANEITLSYRDYAFTINFSPLLYSGQEEFTYSYKLENFDQDWQFATADRRYIHYTNLPPGTYNLKVRSSYDGIHWTTANQELKIIVTPPWWNTLLFKVSIIFFILAITLTIYRIRLRFMINQQLKLEELVRTRTRELEQSTQEIKKLLGAVDEQKRDIENKNQELQNINAELSSNNEDLEHKSRELINAQGKLKDINTNLEAIIDDRTKRLNETLLELETFLYRASHDLRGPISSMLGLLKVAELDPGTSDISRKYLEFQEKSVIRLERTLQKLTQKYNILQSAVTLETISGPVLRNLIEQISIDITSFRENDFHQSIPDKVQFQADKSLLRIILTNLLDNAFYFSTNAVNKNVILDIARVDSKIVISITDYGPGIKDDVKGKVFTMFFRGHELSTGNGLGLYLAKSAVDKMEGDIRIETAEGQYTKLMVSFSADPL